MGLRPLSPTWLSLWLPKTAQATVMEALALTQNFALEGQTRYAWSKEQQTWLENYQLLKDQYQSLWPEPIFAAEQSLEQAAVAWQQLLAWQEAAKTFYSELKQWESDWETCQRWQGISHCCTAMATLPLHYLVRPSEQGLAAGIWRLSAMQAALVPWATLEDVLWQRLNAPTTAKNQAVMPQAYYFMLGKATAILALTQQPEVAPPPSAEAKVVVDYGDFWQVPAALQTVATEKMALGEALATWQTVLESQRNQLAYQEQALAEQYDLARSLAILERLQWFGNNAATAAESHYFMQLTGWFHSPSAAAVSTQLAELLPNTPYLLTTPPPPSHLSAPVILHNPPWVKPFEWFVKAIGIPDKNQIDPSPLLALLVPLLFGYMFGDVGQGAVLAAIGLAFRQTAVGRLLLLGGGSAMFFGVLYGEVFALEGILPPLWLSPLHDPLPLLLTPVFFAMGLLSLGLFLNVLQQYWARSADFLPSLGLWLLYSSLSLSLWQGFFLWLTMPALFLILLGSGFRHLGVALGELLENSLQLAMNTLSFIRVGAFALAHAGLASAVSSLATGAPWWAALLIFILGNILILLIEGLVVSIQTTRLVLFEFFVRFFKGSGRVFVALTLPHWAYRS